ncbi:unnamed protein product [Vitrella brassicaformis CCMP3155]|uniref:Uncharacterized protein n=3 Tax=Vitrella brassicaformis TaxID=1169539 RepID=A0A0G4ENV8_VITBC|nr:unnamed protein product [Vitrella brassicaformis CCMP3155]|eukprot:CEL99126.1 unnamed protein product [Vitrella brassicaformis CCMP3155]
MFFGGFPFGGFEDGPHPGMPGMRREKKEVDNKRFYEVLGVSQNDDLNTIKKAYRKLAMKHHPDKGGDPELFKEIGRAYEVLSDPEKRRTYDEVGEEGLEGSGGGSDPTDIFDLFFGGGGGRRGGGGGRRKGEDVVHPLKVTLSDLYNGKTRKLAINRDIICPDCDGVGGPESAMETCSACKGRGIRVTIRQMGPMIQQMQSPCTECRGQGKYIPQHKQCKRCGGDGTIKERKVLEVFVEKGAPDNKKIIFRGEADERPGQLPGDVIFVIQQQEHPVFTRKKSHLLMKKKITLLEALTGFSFELVHLDNRKLIIKSNPNEVIKPGEMKAIANEGMPSVKNPFIRGYLFISFDVEFPDALDDKTCNALKKLLPSPRKMDMDIDDQLDAEVHYVETVDPERLKEDAARSGEAYEEDEDEGMGGPRVQCRQQ